MGYTPITELPSAKNAVFFTGYTPITELPSAKHAVFFMGYTPITELPSAKHFVFSTGCSTHLSKFPNSDVALFCLSSLHSNFVRIPQPQQCFLYGWSSMSELPNTSHAVFSCATQAPVTWEDVDVTPVKGPDGNFHLPQKIFDSMAETKVGLKGPLATPIGKGHKSLNLALRK